jgi:hypothetical protein
MLKHAILGVGNGGLGRKEFRGRGRSAQTFIIAHTPVLWLSHDLQQRIYAVITPRALVTSLYQRREFPYIAGIDGLVMNPLLVPEHKHDLSLATSRYRKFSGPDCDM